MTSPNDINFNRERPAIRKRTFSAPDKETFNFVFTKSKFGFLRVAQFTSTLISWGLASHFKNNVDDEDESTLVFFLFATIASWVYSIFSIALSLVVMKKRSHDLIRRIMIICCCLTFAVFCLITSSLLADYVRKLNEAKWFCEAIKDSSCGYLEASTVFGFFAVVFFVLDAWYELYILKRIKETALVTREAGEKIRTANNSKHNNTFFENTDTKTVS